jgi:hypothetical protein
VPTSVIITRCADLNCRLAGPMLLVGSDCTHDSRDRAAELLNTAVQQPPALGNAPLDALLPAVVTGHRVSRSGRARRGCPAGYPSPARRPIGESSSARRPAAPRGNRSGDAIH